MDVTVIAKTPRPAAPDFPSAEDERWCRPMFAASLVSLGCVAVTLHLHEVGHFGVIAWCCLAAYLGMYPLFWAEFLRAAWAGNGRWRSRWLYCLLPPLRIGAVDQVTRSRLWLPVWGWLPVGRETSGRLSRTFNLPMLAVALLVLPLVIVEHVWADRIAAAPGLFLAVQSATALIWFAFAVEFILMLSVSPKKLAYCQKHWLDLAIILLPLLAFLRVAQLSRLIRLQQLANTSRAYRLRGLLMKTWRALLVISVVQRVVEGTPERRLEKLRETCRERELELADLRAQIAELERCVERRAARSDAA